MYCCLAEHTHWPHLLLNTEHNVFKGVLQVQLHTTLHWLGVGHTRFQFLMTNGINNWPKYALLHLDECTDVIRHTVGV